MGKILLSTIFLSSVLFAQPLAVPGEFVVRSRMSSTKSQQIHLQHRLTDLGFKLKEILNSDGTAFLIRANEGRSANPEKARSLLDNLEEFDQVEPNYLYFAQDIPRDPGFKNLWGLKNNQRPKADIKAELAWNLTTGSRNVVVAVIDTGVNYNHPDLKGNMWSMPGNPSVHGYNAVNNSLNCMDDNFHGSHVAGTIGAVGDNDVGVVGVNWKVSLMGVKMIGSDGSGSLATAIKAVDWAREHGAQIINASWSSDAVSQNLYDAIARARDAGILFVAAAGNSQRGTSNDLKPTYPANYKLANIISVAATDSTDRLAVFSHYGVNTVDLAAPGVGIISTALGSSYKSLDGTSMASPHVAGAAALLLAYHPNFSYAQLKARLLSSADAIANLKNKVKTGGRLNVYRALNGN